MPRIVGKQYALIGVIGRGGMGEVWQAQNSRTGARVALKIFNGGGDSKLRFRQEAKLAAQLAHPNIVHVYDLLEEEDGTLALVMEHLRGETLASCIARAPLEVGVALAATLPILSALDHAHRSGVIHRDLKPANVFLARTPDGEVVPKLLDFGIAKPAETSIHTLEGHTLGTPEYMSPEQIRDAPDLDGRSDVFSMAVVLYEAITGEQPFRKASASARIGAVLETVVDPNPRIPPKLWRVVSRALSKRAYERPSSAAEFRRELEDAFEQDVAVALVELRRIVHALPDTLAAPLELSTQTLTPRTPRGRLFAFGAVAVAVVVVAIGVIASLGTKRPAAEVATSALVASPAPAPSSASSASAVDSASAGVVAPSAPAPSQKTTVKPLVSAPRKPTLSTKPIATTPGF